MLPLSTKYHPIVFTLYSNCVPYHWWVFIMFPRIMLTRYEHIRHFMSIDLCNHAFLSRRLEKFIVLHILATASLFSWNHNNRKNALRRSPFCLSCRTVNAERQKTSYKFNIEKNAIENFSHFSIFHLIFKWLSKAFHSIVSTHAQYNIVFQSNCSRPTHSLSMFFNIFIIKHIVYL